ncbi:rhomboid family intramembrane serine protease [Limibacter armeniacum]|uniref:rhomboid family intramembrane serine protease n=1 Tax=Limibacter armeniacum TaxID=466084 RepID=UPI002FE609D0
MGGIVITPVVRTLLLINVGIYAVQALLNLPLDDWLGYHYIHSSEFQPYQLITFMFVHANFDHLFSNMLGLFFFGPVLEHVLGQKRFLVLYMVAGVGGGLLYGALNYYEVHQIEVAAREFLNSPTPELFQQFITDHGTAVGTWLSQNEAYALAYDQLPAHPESAALIDKASFIVKEIYGFFSGIPMVGASGAIFGILIGFGYLFPNKQIMLLIPPIPMKAKYLIGAYLAYEVYMLWRQNPGDNVAHLAHLGGALFAFILLRNWGYKPMS